MEFYKIDLKNTHNTRSLSYLKNKDGLNIKDNLLIRSDALSKIDAEDINSLVTKYNLKKIIDLRTENEVYNNPDKKIPGVKYIHNSVLPNEIIGITKKEDLKDDFHDFVEKLKKEGIDSSIDYMINVYKNLVEIDYANEAYGKFLNELLNFPGGATLWHCSAGKDRAGFATFLVLYVLDFELDVIFEDYLATNTFYETHVENVSSNYSSEYKEIIWSIFGVQKEYITTVFQVIKSKYGNLEEYLEKALKFDKIKKEKLKKIYLGE